MSDFEYANNVALHQPRKASKTNCLLYVWRDIADNTGFST